MGGYNRSIVATNEGDRRGARPGDGWLSNVTVKAYTNDANNTLTPADILGGVVTSAGKTANRTLILPLAADMAAAVPNMDVGESLMFQVASIDGFSATITTNTGWTVSGNAIITTLTAKEIIVRRTGAATFDAICL